MSHSYRQNHEFASMRVNSQRASVTSVTASSTLPASLSGGFLVFNSTAASTVTLPAPNSGLQYTFAIGATSASHSITAPSAVLFGSVASAGTTGVLSAASGSTSLATTTGSAAGDSVSLVSDGSKWFVRGSSKSPAGFVFA